LRRRVTGEGRRGDPPPLALVGPRWLPRRRKWMRKPADKEKQEGEEEEMEKAEGEEG
jgi:hypothetical protein